MWHADTLDDLAHEVGAKYGLADTVHNLRHKMTGQDGIASKVQNLEGLASEVHAEASCWLRWWAGTHCLLNALASRSDVLDSKLATAVQQAVVFVTSFNQSQQEVKKLSKLVKKLQRDARRSRKAASSSKRLKVGCSKKGSKQPVQRCSLLQLKQLGRLSSAAKERVWLQYLVYLSTHLNSRQKSTQHAAANVSASSSRATASARRHVQHHSSADAGSVASLKDTLAALKVSQPSTISVLCQRYVKWCWTKLISSMSCVNRSAKQQIVASAELVNEALPQSV